MHSGKTVTIQPEPAGQMTIGGSRIALTGKMGAGKTELARYLSRVHGYVWLSSSDLCRKVSNLIFGDDTRAHLNQLSDTLRQIDKNIWMKALLTKTPLDKRVVIDSVRYTSEALFLQEHGFEIWRVSAIDAVREQRLFARAELPAASHATETELDQFPFDFVFDSSGLSFESVDARIRRS